MVRLPFLDSVTLTSVGVYTQTPVALSVAKPSGFHLTLTIEGVMKSIMGSAPNDERDMRRTNNDSRYRIGKIYDSNTNRLSEAIVPLVATPGFSLGFRHNISSPS